MTRALVLSAETPAALAVVRSLHRAHFEVAVLAESPLSPAALSWRSAVTHRPSDRTSAALPGLVRDLGADLVVPATEADLLRLAPVRDELGVSVVAPSAEALDVVLDKGRVAAAARACGVRTPDEVRLTDAGSVDPPGGWPAVAKPAASRALQADGGGVWAGTATFVAGPDQLAEVRAEHTAAGLDTLLQEVVVGDARLASVLLDHDGELVASFVHRRVRQMRPEGGPSACAESVEPDPVLVDPAVRLARSVGVLGAPVQMEFKVPEGGEPVLLDVNPRPWGSLALAADCGVPFYAWAACMALGERPSTTPGRYRVGVRRSRLPFELRRLLAVWFGGPRPGYDGPWPGRGRALADFVFASGSGMVLRLDDPLPALGDLLLSGARALRST